MLKNQFANCNFLESYSAVTAANQLDFDLIHGNFQQPLTDDEVEKS